MAVTTTTPSVAPVSETTSSAAGLRVPMRIKLLAAFAGAFTLVFLFIALWVYNYAQNAALNRVSSQLKTTAEGGAAIMDVAAFNELIETVPAVADPANPYGLGYPDSPLYLQNAQDLQDIREVVPEAFVYSYFREPADGQLYFAGSAGYFLDPPFGVTFRVPVAEVVSPATYERMEAGLVQTVPEPPYTDEFGSWISTYSPVRDADGGTVGAIGVDFSLAYVDKVREDVRSRVFPALAVSYLVLLLLVALLSSALVRPLRRLTVAASRIADGEYDLDVRDVTSTRFPDEMYDLGQSFAVMAEKVAARERTLTKEVQRLKVEIDATKRAKAVEEITGTDFFSDLTAKASQMRARMRDTPGAAST